MQATETYAVSKIHKKVPKELSTWIDLYFELQHSCPGRTVALRSMVTVVVDSETFYCVYDRNENYFDET